MSDEDTRLLEREDPTKALLRRFARGQLRLDDVVDPDWYTDIDEENTFRAVTNPLDGRCLLRTNDNQHIYIGPVVKITNVSRGHLELLVSYYINRTISMYGCIITFGRYKAHYSPFHSERCGCAGDSLHLIYTIKYDHYAWVAWLEANR